MSDLREEAEIALEAANQASERYEASLLGEREEFERALSALTGTHTEAHRAAYRAGLSLIREGTRLRFKTESDDEQP